MSTTAKKTQQAVLEMEGGNEMGMLLNGNAVEDEEFSKFTKHRSSSENFSRKQVTFRPSKKVNLEVLIDQGNLNISSSRYKWDVSIHSQNCTSGALKHGEEMAKCNHRPEMHPNLSPVETRTQPSVDNADHLKQISRSILVTTRNQKKWVLSFLLTAPREQIKKCASINQFGKRPSAPRKGYVRY